MRLARPAEVPLTCAISGIVVVLAIFEFGGTRTWLYELVIFAAWGLIYLGEWGWRSAGRRPSTSVPSSVPSSVQSSVERDAQA